MERKKLDSKSVSDCSATGVFFFQMIFVFFHRVLFVLLREVPLGSQRAACARCALHNVCRCGVKFNWSFSGAAAASWRWKSHYFFFIYRTMVSFNASKCDRIRPIARCERRHFVSKSKHFVFVMLKGAVRAAIDWFVRIEFDRTLEIWLRMSVVLPWFDCCRLIDILAHGVIGLRVQKP